MKRVRCFVAIELGPRVVDSLVLVAEAIRSADPTWRGEKWVAAENLHITLKFLGDLPETSLPLFAEDLSAAVAKLQTFELVPSQVDARPSAFRARMIWVAFADQSGGFRTLSEAVDVLASNYGIERERRAPTAHATLARARKPRHFAEAAIEAGSTALGASASPMSVSCATLFTSTLTRSKPVYERVAVAGLEHAATE